MELNKEFYNANMPNNMPEIAAPFGGFIIGTNFTTPQQQLQFYVHELSAQEIGDCRCPALAQRLHFCSGAPSDFRR
jgi:hypothetical protein